MKSVGDIKHADDADFADFHLALTITLSLTEDPQPTTVLPYDITSMPRKTATKEVTVFQYIIKGHLSPCGGWPFYW